MTPWLVDVSQTRTAPDDLRRRLRELDPTAEIVYMGDGTWLVGKVRWNWHVYRQCVGMLDHALMMLRSGKAKKLSRQGVRKMTLALLGIQGFRPVAEYTLNGEPDARIVEDFRRSQWLYLNTPDDELIDGILAEQDAAAEATRAGLTDTGRAADAWRYAFTRSHGVTDPWRSRTMDNLKSGRTRVTPAPVPTDSLPH